MGMKNAEASSGSQRTFERRPFSFLRAASQKPRKAGPSDVITDLSQKGFPGLAASNGKLSYNLFGSRCSIESESDFRKGWNDSNFSISKSLKPGTFGRNAGSISRKMFESLFSRDGTRRTDPVTENPLNCDENFIMAKTGGKFHDPSEPIYTDPSLFDLERSRSLRSIDVPSQGQQQSRATGNV